MPIYARKKDANHNSIRDVFIARGWAVAETYRAPGCPDFFASKAGRTVAVEVKSRGGKLSVDQSEFAKRWAGEYALLTSPDQVQELSRRTEGAVTG